LNFHIFLYYNDFIGFQVLENNFYGSKKDDLTIVQTSLIEMSLENQWYIGKIGWKLKAEYGEIGQENYRESHGKITKMRCKLQPFLKSEKARFGVASKRVV